MRLVFVIWFAAAAAAFADPSDAKKDFAAGKKAYDAGDFKKAIDLWKAGYAAKPDPIFLFNLAQAYRQAGDTENALSAYKQYLAQAPQAPNAKEVQTRIDEIEASRPEIVDEDDTVQAPTEADDGAPAEKAPLAPQKAADTPAPGRSLKLAGYVIGGAGVALVATGIAFAAQAESIQSDLQKGANAGRPWTPALTSREGSGRSAAAIADATLVIGALAVATGGVLVGVGMHQASAAKVSAWLAPSGGGVAFALTY
jgi:tetratricopeptide (TPR) repeat protein